MAVGPPIFPAPPRPPDGQWNADYGNQLNRWLQNTIDQLSGFTYGRFGGIMLAPTFPTSGYGLRAGEVFANDGILTVVRTDDIWLGSFAIDVGLGSVTVTV